MIQIISRKKKKNSLGENFRECTFYLTLKNMEKSYTFLGVTEIRKSKVKSQKESWVLIIVKTKPESMYVKAEKESISGMSSCIQLVHFQIKGNNGKFSHGFWHTHFEYLSITKSLCFMQWLLSIIGMLHWNKSCFQDTPSSFLI